VQLQRLDRQRVQSLGGAGGVASHLRSLVPGAAAVEQTVTEILRAVEARGDAAVLQYTKSFDTLGTEPLPLEVQQEQLDEAIKELELAVVAGLQVAIANVALVSQAGVSEDVSVTLPQGQRVTLREIPVRSAAVYVPAGRAPYPSTVVMGVVSARAAGVLDVAVCAPPATDGEIDSAILGTCRLCGVSRVYRMGGAQAIAALAYGTETVAPVEVIVGPGNLYVQEAKRQLSGIVGIDGFAGPSDLLIILDEDVDPRLVALDLLAQAEHGPGSIVAAICCSSTTLDAVTVQLEHIANAQPDLQPAACVLVEVENLQDALSLANDFAPEHLELIGAEAQALAAAVRTAGCLFVGASAATAFGDYVAGSNHILPTAGAARFASSLSASHFRRRMPEVRIDEQAARKLAEAGAPIAELEGFALHAESMRARVRERPISSTLEGE
jgi:histidinol dehydrogenase